MTAQEIYDVALAKLAEFNVGVPSTVSTAFARMTRRQEQLFARGSAINREFFGADDVLTIAANQADTANLVPLPMRVHVVRIEDQGTSSYASGDMVAVVHVDDLETEFAPRATLRDGILEGVSTDWTDVISLRVWYSKRPAELIQKVDIPELPKQFHELLALDVSKWLTRKTLGLTDQSRTEILGILEVEEKELEADFERFLADWAFTETSRFGASARQG